MARTWKFFRAGGFDQVNFTSGQELISIGELDQKLWVALACPVKGLELDSRTLELIDIEKDGRIRASELIAAVRWVGALLKSPDELMKGSDTLSLAEIDDSKPEGARVLRAARELLRSIGKTDAPGLSVADCVLAQAAFVAQPFNGDGVMPAESAPDAVAKAAIEDVIKCVGSVPDRGGKPGVDAARLAQFKDEASAYRAWLEQGMADKTVMVLGEATKAAWAAFGAVKKKIDDYFTRCALVAFDGRAITALNREEKDFIPLGQELLDENSVHIAELPLSHIAAGKPLPLASGVNPAWRDAMAAFVAATVDPLLGKREALTEADFKALQTKLSGYQAHLLVKKGACVEALGDQRVKELLGEIHQKLEKLVAQDKAEEPVSQSLNDVEKLVRCHRDLLKLANNFVAFKDFYSKRAPGIFQAGTLYLDTRAFELCLRVDDPARHALMGPMARAHLLYLDCARPALAEKMSIVAAVTGGDIDNLLVGRNGIFYDRQGRDWDATVTKVIENPISVRQAFWSPYKRVIRFVEEQIGKRAAAAAANSEADLVSSAGHVVAAPVPPVAGALPPTPSPAPAAAAAASKRFDVGTIAALGVAVGGITAAVGAFLQAFFGLGIWMPLGLVGVVLAISGPSMAVAWLKLRQRNLGPLLDANGWAVNAVAKMNVPFGASLTQLAKLPPGSKRDLHDPFAEKKAPWRLYVFLVVVAVLAAGYYLGKLDGVLPQQLQSHEVLGRLAPGAAPSQGPVVPTPH